MFTKTTKCGHRYDIHLAIQLRITTWLSYLGEDVYANMSPDHWHTVIDFKASLSLAEYDGSENIPLAYEVLGAFQKGTKLRTITKEEWKKQYRSYRAYFNRAEKPAMSMLPY